MNNQHQDPIITSAPSFKNLNNTTIDPTKLPTVCCVCKLEHGSLYWRYTEEEHQIYLEKKQQQKRDADDYFSSPPQNNNNYNNNTSSSLNRVRSASVITFENLPEDDDRNNNSNNNNTEESSSTPGVRSPVTVIDEENGKSTSDKNVARPRRRSSVTNVCGSPTEAAPVHTNTFFPVAPNVELHLYSSSSSSSNTGNETKNHIDDNDETTTIAPPIEERKCYCPMCYTISFRQYPTEKHNIKGAKSLWTWTSYRNKGFAYPFTEKQLSSHFGAEYLVNNNHNHSSSITPPLSSTTTKTPSVFKPTLIINTGGTLSCVPQPGTGLLSPEPLYEYFISRVEAFCPITKSNSNNNNSSSSSSSMIPQLVLEKDHLNYPSEYKIPFVLLENPNLMLDSTEASFSEWNLLAMIIVARMNFYSGFVIIHGTDTLAYSASALTFSIFGLTCPVVITGSQTPLRGVHGGKMLQGSSDALMNLLGACDFARQHTRLRGVFVYFHNKVFLGSRVVKAHSQNFDGFSAPSTGCIAFYNGNFTQNDRLLRHIDQARDHEVSALAMHVQKHHQYYSKFVGGNNNNNMNNKNFLATTGVGSDPSSSFSTPAVPGPNRGFPHHHHHQNQNQRTTVLPPRSQSCADDDDSSSLMLDFTSSTKAGNNPDEQQQQQQQTYDEIKQDRELLLSVQPNNNNNNNANNTDFNTRQPSLILAEGCDPRSTRNPADILPFFDRRHNSAIQRFHRSAKVLVFTTRPGSAYGTSELYSQLLAHAVDATEPVALCVLAYGAGNAQSQIKDCLRWVREHCNVPVCFSSQCFAAAAGSSHYSVGLQREHGVNVYDMTFCAIYTRLLLVISQHIFIQCMDETTRQVDLSKFRRSRAFRDCVEDWMSYNHRVSFTPEGSACDELRGCDLFGVDAVNNREEDFNVVRDSSVAMYSS